jgi:arginase family enzyme
LTAYESLELVWQIGKHPLSRGMDVVEIAPSLDQGGVTSIMRVALIMHYLGATKVRLEKEQNG